MFLLSPENYWGFFQNVFLSLEINCSVQPQLSICITIVASKEIVELPSLRTFLSLGLGT